MDNAISERGDVAETSERNGSSAGAGEQPTGGLFNDSPPNFEQLNDADKIAYKAVWGDPEKKEAVEINTVDEPTDLEENKEAEEVQSDQEAKPSLVAPLGFKNRDKFYESPVEVQQEIVDRYRQMDLKLNERAEELGSLRKITGQFSEVLTPVKDYLEESKLPPAEYVKNLVEWERFARNDPATFALSVLSQSGLSKEQVAEWLLDGKAPPVKVQQAPPQQSPKDPEVGELKRRLQEIEERDNLAIQQAVSGWYNQEGPDAPRSYVESPEDEALLIHVLTEKVGNNPRMAQVDVFNKAFEEYLKANPRAKSKYEAAKIKAEIAEKSAKVAEAKKGVTSVTTPRHSDVEAPLPADPEQAMYAVLERNFKRFYS
jgi:hypothetical protein